MKGRAAGPFLAIAAGVAAFAGSYLAATDPAPTAVVADRAGGLTTAFDSGRHAFQHAARNIGLEDRRRFAAGDVVFEATFTEADGLGSVHDADGCAACHANNGRPALMGDGTVPVGVVVAIGGDSAFGVQLQRQAIGGAEPEGHVDVTWETVEGQYPDGIPFELRRPRLTVTPRLPAGTLVGMRVAPPVIGGGLLEAITQTDLEAAVDPDDRNGDGVSGRLAHLDEGHVGRFGWKASTPSVVAQTAVAFAEDLGMDPTHDQLVNAAYYSEALAVTAARDVEEPDVRAGAALFTEVGCASCHVTTFVTGPSTTPGLDDQIIHPYTDLLLHDMGPELDDGIERGAASGAEWRTPPLWGLGLAEVVAGGPVGFLHDGRARTVEEAVLWHGGEAARSRTRFMDLDAAERARLLRFLAAL